MAFQFWNNILDATTADRSSTRKAENIGKAKMEIWSDYYSLHMIYEGMVGNNNVKNIWRNIYKQNKLEKINLIYDFVVQGIRDVKNGWKMKAACVADQL